MRTLAAAAARGGPASLSAAGAPSSAKPPPARGMLFGVQSGLRVEIFTSFEMPIRPGAASAGAAGAASGTSASSGPRLDEEFIREQTQLGTRRFTSCLCRTDARLVAPLAGQADVVAPLADLPPTVLSMPPRARRRCHKCLRGAPRFAVTEVFPSYELLGWYSTGDGVTPEDAALHTQVTAFNEAPIFLQLSPSAVSDTVSKTLPLAVYMAEYHGADMAFSRLPYKIETSEPERVTTDHVLNVAAQRGAGENESSCTYHVGVFGVNLWDCVVRLARLKPRLAALAASQFCSARSHQH